MKVLFCIIFTIYISFPQALACRFKDINSDIQHASINGSNIYTLFSTHLISNHYEAFINAASISPDEAAAEELKKLLREERASITAERKKLKNIKQLINDKKVDWIGVESSSNELKDLHLEVYDYYRIKQKMSSRFGNLLTKEEIDQALSLYFEPETIFLAQRKNKNDRRIKIYPLEGNNIKQISSETRSRYDEVFNELLYIRYAVPAKINATSKEAIDELIELHRVNNTGDFADKLEITAAINAVENPKARQVAARYSDIANKVAMNDAKRDEIIAENALKYKGNGVIIMGSAHKNNLTSLMSNACMENLPSSRLQRSMPTESIE